MDKGQSRSFTVVLNKQSGSHAGDDIEALIRETIPAERLDDVLMLDAGRDLLDLVEQGLARANEAGGCLLLAGGDGTVNGALPLLMEQQRVPFSVLPLGTFNYFARSYGIDLDPKTALTQLLDAQPLSVPVASINGQPFVINVSMGLFPRIIDARERHQGRFGRNRGVALVSGCATALGNRRDNRMLITVDGAQRYLKSPMISVVFNRHQVEILNLDTQCIEQGKLTLLITHPVSRLGMFKLLMRGAIGMLGSADDLEFSCASEIMIGMRRSTVRVAIDGETKRFTTPLKLRVHRPGLQLLAPAQTETEEAEAQVGINAGSHYG